MAIKFQVTNDFVAASRKFKTLARRAEMRAVNAAIKSTRTFISRFITDQTSIKAKDIKARLGYQLADNSTGASVSAAVFVKVDWVPLFWFGARSKAVKTNAGPRTGVTTMQGGSRQLVQGGFIASMKSGKTGIFKRDGLDRLPINQMFTKEVRKLFDSNPGFITNTEERAKDLARKTFEQQFKYLTSN